MRIIFMGTPEFAQISLKALLDEKMNVIGVFTQPDKKVGRKQIITQSAVKITALEHNISVHQPFKIKDQENVEKIKELNPDIIIVVAYGQMLSEEILSIPKYGCINVHGSLLPKYRGAGPIQWAIINGEKQTGITTIYMEKGMDTGDMIVKETVDILENDTAGTLYDKMANIGAIALLKTLDMIKSSTVKREKQDDSESTYAPMLSRETACIDFRKTAEEVLNLIRGTNPWPIAHTSICCKAIKVYSAKVIKNPNSEVTILPGEIITDNTNKKIVIGCSCGAIEILYLQPEGKKIMSAEEYLRGNKINENNFVDNEEHLGIIYKKK